MASILFDDITFPRELYDPDTFEFVAPVSTLLTFTPHIISQLAKTSEEQQEPLPLSNFTRSPTADNANTANASASSSSSSEQTNAPQAAESSAGGIFSSFKNFATSQGTQRIFDNGVYLAGRYMDGSASARQSSYENDYHYDTRSRQSTSSSNYWFGSSSSNRHDYRDQERQRLRDMEERLRQMERDMRQQSAMARSEVDAQRRERVQLEQELESQKQKVTKLEKEVEQQQKEQEANKKKQQEEEKKKSKKQEEEVAAAEKKKKEAKENKDKNKEEPASQEVSTTDSGADAANAVLLATVGVASLVMSLYAAHKASSTYSVVRFHDQLELLIEQCEGVIQSTEAWMSEQFLEVPDQIRHDLKMLKELIETIQRLDPRSEKKVRVSEP